MAVIFGVRGGQEGTAVEVWHLWVIVGIVLFIAEILIPGFLVACFGMGCLASAVLAAIGLGAKWQLLGFSLATLIVYFAIRPLFLKHAYKNSRHVKTNVDALVGCIGVVTVAIDPDGQGGRVKVRGEDWRGVAAEGVAIEPGRKVTVVQVDGTKLLVEPIPVSTVEE